LQFLLVDPEIFVPAVKEVIEKLLASASAWRRRSTMSG
jgi:hypothetical protein